MSKAGKCGYGLVFELQAVPPENRWSQGFVLGGGGLIQFAWRIRIPPKIAFSIASETEPTRYATRPRLLDPPRVLGL